MTTPKFTMPFEPMTIEHLGLRLYSTLPPVLSELVSNAFDAESPKVEVKVPTDDITPTSEVIVRDYGHGMDAQELQNEFLPIGRNRRGADSQRVMSKNGKVAVTGRKGLGKLSAFGIADEMEIHAVKSKEAITLRLKFSAMQEWSKQHGGQPYEPEVVMTRTGPTKEADGVEITLRGLHRTNRVNPDLVRQGLARRLAMIGSKFDVRVNGTAIKPGDRLRRSDCPTGYSWDVEDLPGGGDVGAGLKVTGWVGFLPGSSQEDRGVDIFANGKAIELGSYFHLATTHAQFARAHLVGEVTAGFLDSPAVDLVATARNSVVWESANGQLLQAWGQGGLRWAFDRWLDLRKQEKTQTIITTGGFDIWLRSRRETERRVAERLVKILVDDDALDAKQIQPILEIVKSSVESMAFRELIDVLDQEVTSAAKLIQLFDEWRVIEAREHLQLADGRRSAMDQLQKFIEKGALEVQQLQPLLTANLWLLNPAWTEANEQQTYSKMLREAHNEPKNLDEKDRRIDIIGVTESGKATVVEIKRPEKTLNRRDLEQIEHYVDWARTNWKGTGGNSPALVEGLLVVGKLSQKGDVQHKLQRLSASGIRVETFTDMHNAARRQFVEVEKRLEHVAPEYSRAKRKSAKKSVVKSKKNK